MAIGILLDSSMDYRYISQSLWSFPVIHAHVERHFKQEDPDDREPITSLEDAGFLNWYERGDYDYLADMMGTTSHVTGLHIAAYYGVDEIAEALILNDSVDINAEFAPGISPLSLASMQNHEHIVYKLLEHKSIAFDPFSLVGENALSMAASNGNFGLIDRLLNQSGVEGLEKSHRRANSLALIHATWHGHENIVRLILEKSDIDSNASNSHGSTGLLISAEDGHEGIVRLLLGRGEIEVNLQDGDGDTALICAAREGHIEIMRILLERSGIEVNLKNKNGRTALVQATVKGHGDIVGLLLERKEICINSQTDDGTTALILAVRYGYEEIVRLLLK